MITQLFTETIVASEIKGSMSLLCSTEDMDWLFNTHLKNFPRGNIKNAILIGNEDCPNEIWVSDQEVALMTTPFTLVYELRE